MGKSDLSSLEIVLGTVHDSTVYILLLLPSVTREDEGREGNRPSDAHVKRRLKTGIARPTSTHALRRRHFTLSTPNQSNRSHQGRQGRSRTLLTSSTQAWILNSQARKSPSLLDSSTTSSSIRRIWRRRFACLKKNQASRISNSWW